MLLSNSNRLKIQGIIKRIALDKSITLEERIFVEKFAHHNSTNSLWLKKANSFRRNGTKNDFYESENYKGDGCAHDVKR